MERIFVILIVTVLILSKRQFKEIERKQEQKDGTGKPEEYSFTNNDEIIQYFYMSDHLQDSLLFS
ncbi:MAG: hypothetical protein AABY78_03110 [Nitrospirota bacterium]|jgi:hypothetical protein